MLEASITHGTLTLSGGGFSQSWPYESMPMRKGARELEKEACRLLEASRRLDHYAWLLDGRNPFTVRGTRPMGHLRDYRTQRL